MRTKALSPNEIRAHRIIQRTLADTHFWISTNVSVQAVIEKEYSDGWMPAERFSLYTRGAFDFVVYDADHMPAFAVEVDGFQHDDEHRSQLDRIKNWLCARAGLPLLRLRTDALREDEETSVLAWLVAAYVASDHQRESDPAETEWVDGHGSPVPADALPPELRADGSDLTEEELEELAASADAASDDETAEFELGDLDHQRLGIESDVVVGEPGIEMDHEFPDLALVRTRLLERWGIAPGQAEPVIVVGRGAQYVLSVLHSRALGPLAFRLGAACDYVVSGLDFRVAHIADPTTWLLTGSAKAEFAWANRLPTRAGASPRLAPIDLPWDAWGVARQLAEFSALRQVERWARNHHKG